MRLLSAACHSRLSIRAGYVERPRRGSRLNRTVSRPAPRVAGARAHADTVAGRARSAVAEPCARRQAELSAEMAPVAPLANGKATTGAHRRS